MKKNILIRKAELNDAKIITQILSSAFQEFKDKYTTKAFEATVISPEEVKLRMKKGMVWLVTMNDNPVATVSGKRVENTFYIQGMGVIPEARAKKLGYLLLVTVEEYAKKNNCRYLLLSTTPYLNKAISLYQKFGFAIINEPPYQKYNTPLFNMKKSII